MREIKREREIISDRNRQKLRTVRADYNLLSFLISYETILLVSHRSIKFKYAKYNIEKISNWEILNFETRNSVRIQNCKNAILIR